jgi:transposase
MSVQRMRPDPDLLAELRVEGRSVQDIADRIGLERSTVYRWLARYGIARRPPALRRAAESVAATAEVADWTPTATLLESRRRGSSVDDIARQFGLKGSVVRERLIAARALVAPQPSDQYQRVGEPDDPLPRHLLERLYLGERLVPSEIAELTGTTTTKVEYRLRLYRIPRRRPGTRPILHDLTAELLRYLYQDRQMSTPAIAELLGCSIPSVRERLHAYQIPMRRNGARTHQGGGSPTRASLIVQLTRPEGAWEDGEPAAPRDRPPIGGLPQGTAAPCSEASARSRAPLKPHPG